METGDLQTNDIVEITIGLGFKGQDHETGTLIAATNEVIQGYLAQQPGFSEAYIDISVRSQKVGDEVVTEIDAVISRSAVALAGLARPRS